MNLRVAEANSVNDEDTGNGSENSDEIEERKRLCRESDGVFTLEDVVHNGGSKELLSEALAIESEGGRARCLQSQSFWECSPSWTEWSRDLVSRGWGQREERYLLFGVLWVVDVRL